MSAEQCRQTDGGEGGDFRLAERILGEAAQFVHAAADIALLPGLNTLELRAVDESGNTASRSVPITRATTSPLTLAT
ncbi:MAG: hypothetical protein WCL32_22420, partial [Planctomycetota bacterium]